MRLSRSLLVWLCWIRPILSLVILAAVACSASPRPDRASRIQCSPELEGRFIGGSSGARVGVPLRGSLFLRFKDGTLKPASVAIIALADRPCPYNRPRQLDLLANGEFATTFNLPTDTHRYCLNGEVVEKEAVESLKLTLLVPSCEGLEITLAENSRPFKLQTPCDMAAADYKPEPFAVLPVRVGANVELRGADLYIEGTKVPLPAPLAALESALGKPSKIVPTKGDGNDVYEWESKGVFGYSRVGDGSVHVLGLQLDGESNERHWCDPGTVQLNVNGVRIDRLSEPSALRKSGFAEDGYEWRQRSGGTYATLSGDGESRVYSYLEVGVAHDGT